MSLWRYTLRRLVLLVPVLFGISLVTFILTHVLPSNPVYALVGRFANQQLVNATISRYGLDQPLPLQYGRYMGNLLHGDLGTSIQTGRPVSDELATRLPATLELTTLALILAIALAVLLGTAGALQHGGPADGVIRVVGLIGNSLPEFWLGLLLIFVFYYKLGWAPGPIGRIGSNVEPPKTVTGFYLIDAALRGNLTGFGSAAGQLALPVITLALVVMAPILRMVRANMLEVISSPYIRCADAHGLNRRRLVFGYALKNALLPVITLVAIIYGYLLGGDVLVEKVFSWPGLGLWAAQAILAQDYPSVQALVLVTACFYVVVYLAADLLLAVVDPRIRY